MAASMLICNAFCYWRIDFASVLCRDGFNQSYPALFVGDRVVQDSARDNVQ